MKLLNCLGKVYAFENVDLVKVSCVVEESMPQHRRVSLYTGYSYKCALGSEGLYSGIRWSRSQRRVEPTNEAVLKLLFFFYYVTTTTLPTVTTPYYLQLQNSTTKKKLQNLNE